ncbi:cyclase family protein, partial [Micromonospora sp. M51]|uniref:cyclase family protein n=1 Tax=Micromonospora sp. M51 TaxID=2824889 RepID=UPI001B38BCD3
MTVLQEFVAALSSGRIQVVDLTAPLSDQTPILGLPEQFGQTWPFQLSEISRYDDRGPAWYWNNFSTGEHTGTHFDAPVHWVSGQHGADVSQVPVSQLIAPAVVIDHSSDAADNPDFLLQVEHVKAWEAEHGPLPTGGWLLYRTGWDAYGDDPQRYANDGRTPR